MGTDETRRQFRFRGIHMVPPAGGIEAVLREIESGERTANATYTELAEVRNRPLLPQRLTFQFLSGR